MSDTAQLRTLSRGLDVLRHLDPQRGLSLAELHARTGLAKPTLLRILRTLEAAGFARRALADDRYRAVVRPAPSDSGARKGLLAEIAAPFLDELCRTVLWPSDVAIYEGGYMKVQETSRRRSPFILNRTVLHSRISLVHSGVGLAWLAFTRDQDRIDALAAHHSLKGGIPAGLDAMLDDIRRRGYALRDTSHYTRLPLQARLNAMAVPIISQGFAAAAVNVIWIGTAASEAEMASTCLPHLRTAARRIESAFEVRHRHLFGGARAS